MRRQKEVRDQVLADRKRFQIVREAREKSQRP